MSGGAWDCKYPQFAEDDEIMQHIDNLRLMVHYCKDNNKHLAAHELEGFINVLVGAKQKIHDKFERVKDLIHSIDWCAAGDSSFDDIDKSVEKFSKDANCTTSEPNCRDCDDSGKILVHDPTYEDEDNHREEKCPHCILGEGGKE